MARAKPSCAISTPSSPQSCQRGVGSNHAKVIAAPPKPAPARNGFRASANPFHPGARTTTAARSLKIDHAKALATTAAARSKPFGKVMALPTPDFSARTEPGSFAIVRLPAPTLPRRPASGAPCGQYTVSGWTNRIADTRDRRAIPPAIGTLPAEGSICYSSRIFITPGRRLPERAPARQRDRMDLLNEIDQIQQMVSAQNDAVPRTSTPAMRQPLQGSRCSRWAVGSVPSAPTLMHKADIQRRFCARASEKISASHEHNRGRRLPALASRSPW